MFHVKQLLLLSFLIPFFSLAQHIGTTVLPVKAMPVPPKKDTAILRFLEGDPQYISLKPEQKEWFYWTNYSRSNPRKFWDSIISPILANYPTINKSYTSSLKTDLYRSNPLPNVKPSVSLLKISQAFAAEMSSNNAPPSHTSPSGSTFPERMKASGIINCAGENISFGPPNPLMMLVLLYIDEGVPSLGHRYTLLNPAFIEMGIGTAKYSDNNTIVIQDFACNQK